MATILKSRKNQRLKDFDYSRNGYYFVSICIKNRENHFGEIIDGKMILNNLGKIEENVFLNLPNHYKNCILDEYIFMPNHFHAIIIIDNEINNTNNDLNINDVGTGLKPVPTENMGNEIEYKKHGLSEIIRGFKTFSSRKINYSQNVLKFEWQRSFYDVIIRNDEQLSKTRQYIIDNPLKWEFDKNNLSNLK